MKVIRLLGGAAIEGPEGPLTGREVQRARLALLALLVTARTHSAGRERLVALLWPESDSERGRGLLRDSIYRLREALGDEALPGAGNELRLDPKYVGCDVWEFEEAVERGDHLEADRLYTGPFLDGFFLDDSPEFERWADAERARLDGMYAAALETLASTHAERGDWMGCVVLWRRLAALDPHNTRVALRLMAALDASGDRAGALKHASTHAAILRAELDADPDPDVEAFAEKLRREPVTRHPADAVRVTIASDPQPSVADVDPPSPPAVRHDRRDGRKAILTTGTIVVLTAVIVAAWRSTAGTPSPILDQNVVAVFPFRVTSADSADNSLREGVVDLVGGFLTGDGGPRAIDTRTVLSAYRRAQVRAGGELTTAQLLSLARQLGAGQLLTGELVATSGRASMSARLLLVPSGRVVAQHREQGDGDHLRLTMRVAASLLARSVGEGTARLAGLSDSLEAVRAYLAGMQAYRNVDANAAFNHLTRALDIDPTFAPAALWRAYVAWGAFVFGTPAKRSADSVAWALRGRMVRRDSLVLASLPSIGPKYPEASTARDVIQAQELAARANPDRVEVWDAWANHLIAFGSQAEIENHLDVATAALDQAIALDSTFTPALSLRMQVALQRRDRRAIGVESHRYFKALADTNRGLHWRYAVAYVLGDSARLPSLLARLAQTPGFTWQNIELWSLTRGFSSIEDAERIAKMRIAWARVPDERNAALRSFFRIAAARGRAVEALSFADSIPDGDGRQPLITLSLLGHGYDSAAAEAVRFMEASLRKPKPAEGTAHTVCYSQLWRVARGDTASTRRAIARMRALTRTLDAAPGWRVGRLDLCAQLLEAAVEQQGRPPASRSPALDRVEQLVRRGPQAEQPGNLARLLIAGWREAQGDYRTALAVVRGRDPMAWHVASPAAWRIEGRLAALAGDTAGAVHAYRSFLALRDQPDPGPISAEVLQVREHLARLTKGGG